MPPRRQQKVAIDDVNPTEEEMLAARNLIAKMTSSAKRSKMGCLSSWLKSNDDKGNHNKALGSRGEEREAYLAAYMTHMSRLSQAKVTTMRESTQEKAQNEDTLYWSKFEMDKEIGGVKGAAWRKVLKWRPDPVTGEDGEEMREYVVPRDWQRNSGVDRSSFAVEAKGDATEADLANLDDLCAKSSIAGPSTGGAAEVKTEALAGGGGNGGGDDKSDANAVDTFITSLATTMKRMIDMQCDLEAIQVRAGKGKYSAELASDVQKSLGRFAKMIKIMKRMLADTSNVSKDEVPKFMKLVEAEHTTFDMLREWAVKFGFVKGKAALRKRKSSSIA